MVHQVYFKDSSVKGVPIISGIKYFRLDSENHLSSCKHFMDIFSKHLNVLIADTRL